MWVSKNLACVVGAGYPGLLLSKRLEMAFKLVSATLVAPVEHIDYPDRIIVESARTGGSNNEII